MSNDLVGYSRAGDAFHYRWAARRCLRLIDFNTKIQHICIEGSSENEKKGEYVIDVSEYGKTIDGIDYVDYYQLKHTEIRKDNPFQLSELKGTIEGFADRFLQHFEGGKKEKRKISFIILTNRKIAVSFKGKVRKIAKGETVDNRFLNTITDYSGLKANDLKSFCEKIRFEDSEFDYTGQKNELKIELSQLVAGSIDNKELENLVSMVSDKVLPGTNPPINREEVLKRLDVQSERQLFPAPPEWEAEENIIEREQYAELEKEIRELTLHVIVEAPGGVGKSVFTRQLLQSLPNGSFAIAYDCFGAGSYRRKGAPRHRHRDALVQLANELALNGLCSPLIVRDTTHAEDIISNFYSRIETAISNLKKIQSNAKLYILIDAADNAEMVAEEYNDDCFVHEILREPMPEDCRLIFLCRPERTELLLPQSTTLVLKLEPFAEFETLQFLRIKYPEATEEEGIEFHRLTSANPRVQANALDGKHESLHQLLSSFGPKAITVEDQIQSQLNKAIDRIKDLLSKEYQEPINRICKGVACLPPHIPIDVLSKISNVSSDTIRSFISDIGRALWISNKSVQFRDEPTETWFRQTFLSEVSDIKSYIDVLEPIAKDSTYVSEILPQLYLQAEKYEKLIDVALSDEFLPESNPIDARNIRVYRLQFAFKAALKQKKFADAIKLAMRAGEEMAGNHRQLNLLQSNIDLLVSLQESEKVQELAFKRILKGGWNGSENIYSASLLSGKEEFHGEAKGYLRAAINWLNIYFEELKSDEHRENEVTSEDITELAFATLNLDGIKACTEFFSSLKPKSAVFVSVSEVARRLITLGRFQEVFALLKQLGREPYYVVAIVSELYQVGVFPEVKEIEVCLDQIYTGKKKIKKPNDSWDENMIDPIISFLEACLHRNLPTEKILKVLEIYVPVRATQMVHSSYDSKGRDNFLRALAIRNILTGSGKINMKDIYPEVFSKKQKKGDLEKDKRKFGEVVGGLIPWYLLRAKLLQGININLHEESKVAEEASTQARSGRYDHYDTLPKEIAEIKASILIFGRNVNSEEIKKYYEEFLQDENSFNVIIRLQTLHAAYRTSHLSDIRQDLQLSTYNLIKTFKDSSPDSLSEYYIKLARSVLVDSIEDASCYFEEAINVASKFGEELGQRWDAVTSLAKKSCEEIIENDELAYRYIRCAEMVGTYIDQEKYWNRSEALRLCAKMSPGIAISAFSRWRDRDIGRFEYQLIALLTELVGSDLISQNVGWALTKFTSGVELNDFLAICLKKEKVENGKSKLLADAVELMQKDGEGEGYWKKIKEVADQYHLENEELNKIIKSFQKEKCKDVEKKQQEISIIEKENDYDKEWDEIFEGIEIATQNGFKILEERCYGKANENFRFNTRNLLTEAIKRLPEKAFKDFFNVLLKAKDINQWDIEHLLRELPEQWKSRISFKKGYPQLINRIGERFALELVEKYSYDSFIEFLAYDKEIVNQLNEGLLKGLDKTDKTLNDSVFFDFVKLMTEKISPAEAREILVFALDRLECHIDDDFSEGIWKPSLKVSSDINESIAGFIWAALGAPQTEVRWRAMHCIRLLAKFNSKEVIDSLINWFKKGIDGVFGARKFPFYQFNAKQYLLMALARVSIDNVEILEKHCELFAEQALKADHLLIQKYSAEIALKICLKNPDIYPNEIQEQIKNVGKSRMPILKMDPNYKTDSYWHENGQIEEGIDFYFGWDFDNYWYRPLGNVFGISSKQVQDLAANIICREWGKIDENGYDNDPRVELWNQSQWYITSHSHGGYPRVENWDFYYSYHAMMVVAARLIDKMPAVKAREYIDDDLANWIARHTLTREDGKWLSDCRDPLPLDRPKWINNNNHETWQTDIKEQDFVQKVLLRDEDGLWICIKGGWQEYHQEMKEECSISSALVSINTSDSLLKALETCEDPHDFKLPYYEEEDFEISKGIYNLIGMIEDDYVSKRIDADDPFADEIAYPPFSIGQKFIEQQNLISEEEGKIWRDEKTGEIAMKCETWASHREERDDYQSQAGIRLKARVTFLQQICKVNKCNIIIEVDVERNFYRKYDRNREQYMRPKQRLFLITEDGRFKSTRKDLKIG